MTMLSYKTSVWRPTVTTSASPTTKAMLELCSAPVAQDPRRTQLANSRRALVQALRSC